MVSSKLINWIRSLWQCVPHWARRPFQRFAYLLLRLFVGASVELVFGDIRFRVKYESLSEFWNARLAGRYEPEFLAEFIANLRKTKMPIVVYDIGAYYGFYTLVAASYRRVSKKNVHIVAFEPDPAARERLEQNIELNGFDDVAVKPVTVGAAKEDQSKVFPGDGAGLVSLDDLIELDSIPPPSLIKMDIEGHEFEAIRGMKSILKTYGPELLIEVHSEHLSHLGTSVGELVGYLDQLGYSKASLHEKGKGASFGHQQEHMLFVPLASEVRLSKV